MELLRGGVAAAGPGRPNVVLIKVDAHTAEYWDTPGGRVASLLSLAKSKVTGEPYKGTERERWTCDL